MNNWYAIGEQVLLVSKSQPQHNGEYVIKDIVDDKFYDVVKEIEETGVAVDLGFVGDMANQYWDIKAIRKKCPPADESFKDMMQNIKSNVKVEEGLFK